ncbi:MAG: tetratricopeptide repeat protein [Elusimicrobia bacterium]|nr:tetratricopeptide repeat protein [Candidatus Liberimonas magnetica]
MKKKVVLIFLGVIFSLVLIEAGLRLGGFIYNSRQEIRNREELKKKQVCRILCLGESTTQKQYPKYLEEELNNRDIGIKFSVIDKGRAGTNTNFIAAKLEEDLDRYKPDMIITMMGINDGRDDIVFEYENGGRKSLIRSIKIYKLARLLKLHINSKLAEVNKINDSIEKTDYNNEIMCVKKGHYYMDRGEYEKAEEMFRRALELNPKSVWNYTILGSLYRDLNRNEEAEKMYQGAININPKYDQGYLGLGDCFFKKGKYKDAEAMYKEALELNPKSVWNYKALGDFYEDLNRNEEAEKIYQRAIQINPDSDRVYFWLGDYFLERGRYEEAEKMYKKSIQINPKNEITYKKLSDSYRKQKKYSESMKIFDQGVKVEKVIQGRDDVVDDEKKLVLKKLGKEKPFKSKYFGAAAIYNYKKLRKIVKKRGIKYVCVQYPTRKLDDLKSIFKEDEDIVFVDNEKTFKEAVKEEGYNEYFIDRMAENFGHCTLKGNKLLARNIADAIIKEVFNRQ